MRKAFVSGSSTKGVLAACFLDFGFCLAVSSWCQGLPHGLRPHKASFQASWAELSLFWSSLEPLRSGWTLRDSVRYAFATSWSGEPRVTCKVHWYTLAREIITLTRARLARSIAEGMQDGKETCSACRCGGSGERGKKARRLSRRRFRRTVSPRGCLK